MLRNYRKFMVVALVLSAVFAAWSWFRPYAWSGGAGTGCRVIGCQMKQDRSNYWLDIHLKVNAGQSHNLLKPVALITSSDRRIEVADTTFSGDPDANTIREIWLKFWLEKADLSGPLSLRINDGSLSIRTESGEPKLGGAGTRYFVTNQW